VFFDVPVPDWARDPAVLAPTLPLVSLTEPMLWTFFCQ
jgi:hypothetical protein